jgi:mono/diheme cytochrome c family protein
MVVLSRMRLAPLPIAAAFAIFFGAGCVSESESGVKPADCVGTACTALVDAGPVQVDGAAAVLDAQVPVGLAPDGAVTSVPSTSDGGAPSAAGASGDLPCEVASVFASHCASCHGTATAAGAPMSLATRADLMKEAPLTKGHSSAVEAVARMKNDARPMPPAPMARVSASDLAKVEAWVAAGMPAGTASCAAPAAGTTSPTSGSVVPKPAECQDTFEITAHGDKLEEPFKIAANPKDAGNQYHCFYFNPPYKADSGVLWFESILDNTKNLHHWILYATDNATHPSGTSAACNASEPGSYFVAGWAPGANNVVIPNDTSLAMPSGPNAGLILELHYYNNTGAAQVDKSGLRFCTAPKSSRKNVAAVHTTGSEGICLDAGEKEDVVGKCSPRTDMGDIHIVGVWPHMHKLARRQKLVVQRAGGTSETIHDEAFDFNAQIFYPKDVVLKPGDKLETHCVYDNDTNAQVHYGENTQQEMCYSFIMAWPAGALANAPGILDTGGFPLNRCVENLSILNSCNGAQDAPKTIAQDP